MFLEPWEWTKFKKTTTSTTFKVQCFPRQQTMNQLEVSSKNIWIIAKETTDLVNTYPAFNSEIYLNTHFQCINLAVSFANCDKKWNIVLIIMYASPVTTNCCVFVDLLHREWVLVHGVHLVSALSSRHLARLLPTWRRCQVEQDKDYRHVRRMMNEGSVSRTVPCRAAPYRAVSCPITLI